MSSKRRRKKARVPGLIITIILLLLVAEFVGLLAVTKLLPIYLLFAVGIVFMTCVLLVAMLTGNFRKKHTAEPAALAKPYDRESR